MNAIIRLDCIEGDTGFKYKRFGDKGQSRNRYRSTRGGAIEET